MCHRASPHRRAHLHTYVVEAGHILQPLGATKSCKMFYSNASYLFKKIIGKT